MSSAFCGKIRYTNHRLTSHLNSIPIFIVFLSLCLTVRLQHLRGNLARLRSCVEELRSISGDGCSRGAARGGELLQQAVLDSLQQFKQYMRHSSSSSTKQARNNNIFLEVGNYFSLRNEIEAFKFLKPHCFQFILHTVNLRERQKYCKILNCCS